MGMKTVLGTTTTACVALALTIATGGVASAADNDNMSTADEGRLSARDTADALADVGGGLVLDPVAGAGIGEVELADSVSVGIPVDPTGGISLESGGVAMSIGLPGADGADSGVVQADGTVTYPGVGFSSSVVASETGLQFLTTIAGSDAPTRYEYELALDEGAELRETGGGTFAIFDQRGNPLAMILPAWARDANGSAVPTHFALEGHTLVQYTDHHQSGVAYPVVADPQFAWMGPLPTVKLTRTDVQHALLGHAEQGDCCTSR